MKIKLLIEYDHDYIFIYSYEFNIYIYFEFSLVLTVENINSKIWYTICMFFGGFMCLTPLSTTIFLKTAFEYLIFFE